MTSSISSVSVGGKIARYSRIPKLRDSGSLGGGLAGSFPLSSSPPVLPEREGTGVSVSYLGPPPHDVSLRVFGASVSQMVELSADSLRDILSSAQVGDS